VSHLTANDILGGIEDAHVDFHTVAEGFGIEDEEVVDQALGQLQIEPVSETGGVKFRLRYRSAEFRPVLIHLWDDAEILQEEREEALEQLEEVKGKAVKRVRSHLDRVVEVAALELGWSQVEDMGIVLASQVAEYLAMIGDGLIRDQNDDWWAVEDHVPVLLIGSERRG